MNSAGKIKVLHLVTRMNVGGVAVLVDNLMRNLNSEDFEALLAFGSCEAPEIEYLDSQNISYQFIRIKNFRKSLNFKDDISAFINICRLIREFRPEIIHTHTSKAGLFGRVAGLLVSPRSKRIHTFHGHLLYGYFGSVKLYLVKLFEKSLAKISDGLIAMGSQVSADLISEQIAPVSKFRVLMPGVIQPIFPTRAEARSTLHLDDHRVYCVFIGRLTQIKRPDRLIEIARRTKLQNENVTYLVVGDGELSEQLQTESNYENLPINFLGWRDDVPTVLAASDFLILTSDNEAVALTLVEAAQAGIPIITTPAGSVRDIARNGENAIVTTFEIESLVNAVTKLVSDGELRSRMGKQGFLIANSDFSIATMVEKHHSYYMEILRN